MMSPQVSLDCEGVKENKRTGVCGGGWGEMKGLNAVVRLVQEGHKGIL